MTGSHIERAIREIRSDNRSSASQIGHKVLGLYESILNENQPRNTAQLKQQIGKLTAQIANVQPSMTSLQNIELILTKSSDSLADHLSIETSRARISKLISRIESHLQSASQQIAKHACSILSEHSKVITLSYSATVANALICTHGQRGIDQVILSEARPLMEGQRLARLLRKHGIDITLVVDAALPALSREADIALVGGDTILPNGSLIHKIGTYPLALAMADQKKPFYVAADALKFQQSGDGKPRLSIEEKSASEVLGRKRISGVRVRNFYFDITPPRFITAFITEFGVVKPSRVSEIPVSLEMLFRDKVSND